MRVVALTLICLFFPTTIFAQTAGNKVVVIPLGAEEPIRYSGIAPIIVNNDTNTISFQAPPPPGPDSNMQPSLAMYYIIATVGVFPSRSSANPLLGTIVPVGFGFAPRGWASCEGQLLAISQNTALFSLLGTTFGGDGRVTFALPDLRGRTIIGQGTGPGLSTRRWGERLGTQSN